MDSFFSRLVLSNETSYRVGRHFLFWTVCWLFMGFIYGFFYRPEFRYISYMEAFLFMFQHMFLSYTIIYIALPQFILKEKYWTGFILVIGLIVITAILSPITNFVLIEPYRRWINYPLKNLPFFGSFMGGLRGSMTVAGFAVAIKLIKYWHTNKIENEHLEKEKLKAELEVLKGQLHPHFMFNTLNSIYALSLKKSDQTPEAILKLSQLMRYILTDCNQPIIPLKKETEVLQHYIELEKGRFHHRLDMQVHVTGDLENNKIAPLLLLPFLENSFKHGANEMIEQAWISLDLGVENNILKFKLINGRAPNKGSNPNSVNVGLQNVKKRLQLLYPEAHELRITEDADIYVVSLALKLDLIRSVDV